MSTLERLQSAKKVKKGRPDASVSQKTPIQKVQDSGGKKGIFLSCQLLVQACLRQEWTSLTNDSATTLPLEPIRVTIRPIGSPPENPTPHLF